MKAMNVLISVLALVSHAQAASPRTILELNGVPKPKFDFSQSVLVIIDAQQEYTTGKLPLTGVKPAAQNIRKLLDRAREKKIPIIHVMQEGKAGGLFDPKGPSYRSIPEAASKDGEITVIKHFPNAFADTSLEQELAKHGKDKTLVLAGFMTHLCITSTASAALDHGHRTFVVEDGVATRDLVGTNGETIPAKTVHASSLAAIRDRLGWTVKTQELLGE